MAAFNYILHFSVFCWLAGICAGNNPPFVNFGPPSGYVFFSEDTAINTKLFHITATDSDSNSVTIDIDPGNKDTQDLVDLGTLNYSATRWTRDVLLKTALDRDRNPNQRTLLFVVKDEVNTLTGKVVLIIRDVNDNPPTFTNLPYRITLQEDHIVNTTVFNVTATDPDDGPGGSVRFSMAAQAQGADYTYNTTFIMENTGKIFLRRNLDYETTNYYQYQVNATDGGNPACPGQNCSCNNISEPSVNCNGDPTIFAVTVTDVQDTPPFFTRLPYIVNVYENISVSTSFYQVTALDGDRGIPNEITYSIVGAYPFEIDNKTGILTVAQGLDADDPQGRSYILTVMASEVLQQNQTQLGDTNTTTQVSISVLDINDNPPTFNQTEYAATVQENTPRGVPLTMTGVVIVVTDKDQNENSQFVLSLEKDGLPYQVFDTLPPVGTIIQGTSTVIVTVNNSTVLDYEETKNITFQLVAREVRTANNFSGNTTVTVQLEDMNDNSPVFVANQSQQVNVTEHDKNNTVLANFTATDNDSGVNGEVTYALEENQAGKFAINATTGELTVAGEIDREMRASYSVVVVATDNTAGEPNNRRSARLIVGITVLDINDHAPEFEIHSSTITVQETAPNGTTLMTLTAKDIDEGDNAKVVYEVLSIVNSSTALQSGLFEINRNNGVVFVNNSLIDHSGSYNVTFVAYDSASDPRNDTTEVLIVVQDVNLNTPVFVEPDESMINLTAGIVANVSVLEGQPTGSEVTVLKATDKDLGPNGIVQYFLEPDQYGNFQNFRLNATTGNLTNFVPLLRQDTEFYQLSVKAEDTGSPNRLSKIIPLRVNLNDTDNNPPRFNPPKTLSLEVGEETANVSVGFVNISTDVDIDPENRIRCYYLYGGQILDAFSLNKSSGELYLTQKLDRDKISQVRLVVKVSANCSFPEAHFYLNSNNSYNDSDDSLLDVTIKVKDINDNPPVFDKNALIVGMLYDAAVNTSVFELKQYTTDNDTEENSQNMYRLKKPIQTGGNMPQDMLDPVPFNVSINGSVVTNRLFRADLQGYFILTVEVYDKDNQTDEGDLKIFLVGDIQRIKLVFNRQPDQVLRIFSDVKKELEDALGFEIIQDKIATHVKSNGQADPDLTDVYIHARYIPSGEIVPRIELESAFDYNLKVRKIFQDYGIQYALAALAEEQQKDDETVRAFIIVACVLGIICLVLIAVLINTIRRYHRRLRAATTSAFVSEKQELDAYVPPGTNKYFAAENPLFGRDMKIVDPDRLSNDSLDDNVVGGGRSGEKNEEQEMYLDLYDEHHGPRGAHVSHLAMVLSEYDKGQSGQPDTTAPSSPSAPSTGTKDNRKTSMNGHVKSDSGFNEQGSLERSDGFQYTDI